MNGLIAAIDLFRSRNADGSLRGEVEMDWEAARKQFIQALGRENSAEELEAASTYKWSWELPVDLKMRLFEEAKRAGCDSFEFWQDYYKFLAANLTPSDPEFAFALEMANGKYR